MKIIADATLTNTSTYFPPPFELTHYDQATLCAEQLKGHHILLCRSTLPVTADLLKNTSIECVATASSGIDHIDTVYLAEQRITLFDAKGSNATAVADYVLMVLALLQQHQRLHGHRVGIIGLGSVGQCIAERLSLLKFDIVPFDPIKDQYTKTMAQKQLKQLQTCDLISVHANLHDDIPFPSRSLLNAHFFAGLKPNSVILNAARGGIINEQDLLSSKIPITYCTDVYQHEPNINPEVIDFAWLCTPHIAGHSLEAKEKALIQLSQNIFTHYGLPSPTYPTQAKHLLTLQKHWQSVILETYNPLDDTHVLKTASNKTTAFLTQRQTHRRHEFETR